MEKKVLRTIKKYLGLTIQYQVDQDISPVSILSSFEKKPKKEQLDFYKPPENFEEYYDDFLIILGSIFIQNTTEQQKRILNRFALATFSAGDIEEVLSFFRKTEVGVKILKSVSIFNSLNMGEVVAITDVRERLKRLDQSPSAYSTNTNSSPPEIRGERKEK